LLDGLFTNAGLAALAGLDGVFSLSLFWHASEITSEALGVLWGLSNLGSLRCDGELCDDAAMCHVAALPRLRMLIAQDTVATDRGFVELSRSESLEHLWARDCVNLTGTGFRALARMPGLRGLGVHCHQVDDSALAVLPAFAMLRELVPMGVPDSGFRHIGRCEQLQKLWCMYCRDTSDTATEHIARLRQLKSYYAGKTQITDRTLQILGAMTSLERIEFFECKGVTDAGLVFLTALPRLREIVLSNMPNVTFEGTSVFPARLQVEYTQ
jgi:hypothetical protein